MSLPKGIEPLITRIREVLNSGYGNPLYSLPANKISDNYSYDGRELIDRARDALVVPNFLIKVTGLQNRYGLQRGSNTDVYDIDISVEIVYKADAPFIKDLEIAISTALLNLTLDVRRTLTMPNNLYATQAGARTGLSSGTLTDEGISNPVFDYKLNTCTTTISLSGILWTRNF